MKTVRALLNEVLRGAARRLRIHAAWVGALVCAGAVAAPAPACGDPQVIRLLTDYERAQVKKAIADPTVQMSAGLVSLFGVAMDARSLNGQIRIYGIRTLGRDTKAGRNECRARVTLDYVRPINGETDTTDDVSYVVELTDTPGEFLVSNIEGGL